MGNLKSVEKEKYLSYMMEKQLILLMEKLLNLNFLKQILIFQILQHKALPTKRHKKTLPWS